LSLDDLDVADLARRDPEALVGGSTPIVLDEIQREPELLSAVKRAIDGHRRRGQFKLLHKLLHNAFPKQPKTHRNRCIPS
jgi:predicted AAA+ superfamily ATPase